MAEVVVALDVPRAADAYALFDRVPELEWVKVGPGLMAREGPAFIRTLVGRGLRVFLDLKLHDIPSTVAGAVAAARELGVAMVTVHALGGRAMLEASAVAAGGELAVVGVTVLTSHDSATYARAVGRADVEIAQEAERLAVIAAESGLRGVVCSPKEVSLLRRRLGADLLIVVPGIRRRADPLGDQARVATAKDAASNGASHLVVGRPILQAADPAAAFEEFLKEAWCTRS